MSIEIGLCGVDKLSISDAYFKCSYWDEKHEHYQKECALQELCKSLGVLCYDTFRKDINNMEAMYHYKVSECTKQWSEKHSNTKWQHLYESCIKDWPQWMLQWENNHNQLAHNAKQHIAVKQERESGGSDDSGSSSDSQEHDDGAPAYTVGKCRNKQSKFNLKCVKAQQLLFRVEVVTCCGDVWKLTDDDCKYLEQLLLHSGDELTVLTKRCIKSVLCTLSVSVLLGLIGMMRHTTLTGPHWNTLRKLYKQRGRYCSALLLQRRWYEICRMVQQNKSSYRAFIMSLTTQYPFLRKCSVPSWNEMLRNKQLYTDKQLDSMKEVDIVLYMQISEFGAHHLELDRSDNNLTTTLIFDDSDDDDDDAPAHTRRRIHDTNKDMDMTVGNGTAHAQRTRPIMMQVDDDNQTEDIKTELSMVPVVVLERLNVDAANDDATKNAKRAVRLPDMCDVKRIHNGANTAQVAPICSAAADVAEVAAVTEVTDNKFILSFPNDKQDDEKEKKKTKASSAKNVWCCLAHKHAYYCCLRTILTNRKGKTYTWPSHRHPAKQECRCCCTHLLDGQHVMQAYGKQTNKKKQANNKRKNSKHAATTVTVTAVTTTESTVTAERDVSDKDKQLKEWLTERQYASKVYGIKARPINTVSYTDFVKNKLNPPIIINDTAAAAPRTKRRRRTEKEESTRPPDPTALSGREIPNVRSITAVTAPARTRTSREDGEPDDPNAVTGRDVPELSAFTITSASRAPHDAPVAVRAASAREASSAAASDIASVRTEMELIIKRCPTATSASDEEIAFTERVRPRAISADAPGARGVHNTLSIVSISSAADDGTAGTAGALAGDAVDVCGVGDASLQRGGRSTRLYDERRHRTVGVAMKESPVSGLVTLASTDRDDYGHALEALAQQINRHKSSQSEATRSSDDELIYRYIAQNNGTV